MAAPACRESVRDEERRPHGVHPAGLVEGAAHLACPTDVMGLQMRQYTFELVGALDERLYQAEAAAWTAQELHVENLLCSINS